jgi:hypothetical protein
MVHWWNDAEKGKPKYSGKIFPCINVKLKCFHVTIAAVEKE